MGWGLDLHVPPLCSRFNNRSLPHEGERGPLSFTGAPVAHGSATAPWLPPLLVYTSLTACHPECGTQQWPLVAGDREATGERALFPSGFSVGASSIQTRSCLVTGGPTYTPWGSGQHPWPPPSGYQGHTQL